MAAIDLLEGLIARARAAGAEAADAVLVSSTSLTVQYRLGQTEHLERSEACDIGLRVFVGRRSAIVSSSNLDPSQFSGLGGRAVAMARVVPEDPHGGLAELAAPAADDLDLDDPTEPDAATLIERAREGEAAALDVKGVTNSEGAEAGCGRTEVVLVTSAGFAGRYRRSSHSLSVTALAGQGTGMQRDFDYSASVHLSDLDSAVTIGRTAGEKAVARLNPTRPMTAKLPVVYDPRVAGSLLHHLAGAINGAAVARGTTFLRGRLGEMIFSDNISIVDDPRRKRGHRSRPFDGEGVPTQRRKIVKDGVLATWLLDSRSARQLGMVTTGHAGRGTGSPPMPGPTNFYMQPGPLTPRELMEDIREGLYVTELIGMGVNGVTGDYSRGAAGFMIRDGKRAEPVAEITIAGRLQDMFVSLTPASDLRFRRGTDAPTVRVEGMTIAGS